MEQYGSLINHICANNVKDLEPQVGMGATELCWSDRYPFKIIEVNKDKKGVIKSVIVQAMKYYADKTKDNQMGHDNWIIEDDPNGNTYTLKWRKAKNGWYSKGTDGKGWLSRFLIGHAEYHYDWSF